MSKRKRASLGKTTADSKADDTTDDAAEKDDMVHVTSDMLAGSPHIFAGKKTEPAPEADEEAPAGLEESVDEPVEEPGEANAASTTLSPEPEPAAPAEAPVSPSPSPPP